MIWVKQSNPFLSCFKLSKDIMFLLVLINLINPTSCSFNKRLIWSLPRIKLSFPKQFYDFFMISSLFLTSIFLNRYRMRFFRSNSSPVDTSGHFLINSVIILISMISTSVFLSLNYNSLEIDFRKRFYNLCPCSIAAWWITVAAHAPYLSLFF